MERHGTAFTQQRQRQQQQQMCCSRAPLLSLKFAARGKHHGPFSLGGWKTKQEEAKPGFAQTSQMRR
ncbi:hypothetical protein FQA47_001930 [Oryzias melastigma]|uniref:Uncharacterized protein n=1 Tax=Oryzias melastigma TaxID=30732 RepID=A0A834FH53_ORYME|nr:hypothetical protein FQA47_001930 [Oryzias melastigma]